MSKIKYQLNKETLSLEKIDKRFGYKLYKVILPQFVLSLILGVLIFIGSTYFISSPAELSIKEENDNLRFKYNILNSELNQTGEILSKLENRDDNIYRMIFQAEPVSATKRNVGFGGVDRYAELKQYKNSDIIISISQKLEILSKKMLVQSESYNEITELASNKEKMAASIPAIQPIAQDELTRFGSAFGRRFHPIYHVYKMHTGVDLSAPTGTKIHATGDGTVFKADYAGGYGKVVKINHGFGYVTFYAHMSKILVKPGQKVKRGDVIGLVGSTGTSTAPHVHYEVRINGNPVNPVNFYYNDLTDEEYNQMIEASATSETHIFE